MPVWMTGISYAASMMRADSAVAYGGMAAVTGIFVCWFYLSRFGIESRNEVFVPTDEPYGLIEATVRRK